MTFDTLKHCWFI